MVEIPTSAGPENIQTTNLCLSNHRTGPKGQGQKDEIGARLKGVRKFLLGCKKCPGKKFSPSHMIIPRTISFSASSVFFFHRKKKEESKRMTQELKYSEWAALWIEKFERMGMA